MSNWIEMLIKLQVIDTKILSIENDISNNIPNQIRERKDNLDSSDTGMQDASDKMKSGEVAIKNMESKIASLRSKLEKQQTQSLEIKKNNEYKAILSEIANTKSAIKTTEDDELLALIVNQDELKLLSEEAKKNNDGIKGIILQEIEALEKKEKEFQKEIEVLIKERTKIATKVDPKPLDMYERIRKTKVGKRGAFVEVFENGMCGCCHMKVPPQTHNIARKGKVVRCDNCGIMIYSTQIVQTES